MVPVPAVQNRLDLVRGEGRDNGPRGLRVVSLSRSVSVESRVVYNTARGTVMLGCDHHPTAPSDGVVHRDLLQNTGTDISVKTVLDRLLPVERDLTGSVDSHGPSLLVNKDPERRGVVHQVEGLVLTDIEGTGLVPVQDVLPESGNILRCRGTGEDRWGLGRELTSGT